MRKLFVFLPTCLFLLAQEKVDEVTHARMRSEEMEHSQLLHTLHMLTDVYGPRVTGTPNHEAAAKWAIAEMTRWGLKNAHLEPWEFGHPGWLNESADGHIVSPVKQNLKFEVIAWTPSTNGSLTGSVIEVQPPQGPFPLLTRTLLLEEVPVAALPSVLALSRRSSTAGSSPTRASFAERSSSSEKLRRSLSTSILRPSASRMTQ
jgi:hypothetical protein